MKAASKINKPAPKLTSPELQAYATRRLPRQDEQTVGQLFDRANDRK